MSPGISIAQLRQCLLPLAAEVIESGNPRAAERRDVRPPPPPARQLDARLALRRAIESCGEAGGEAFARFARHPSDRAVAADTGYVTATPVTHGTVAASRCRATLR